MTVQFLKRGIVTSLAIVIAAGLLSFSTMGKSDDRRYGGTASCTVEVQEGGYSCGAKGERRVVEVSMTCYANSYADAQANLKGKIDGAMSWCEKQVSSISYNIHSCD